MKIPDAPAPAAFTSAQSAYLRAARRPGNRLARLLALVLHRICSRHTGALALIVAVTGLTIGLCI